MEKDIEILEDTIKSLRERKPFNHTNEEKIKAIENLIAKNKELQNGIHKEYEIGF